MRARQLPTFECGVPSDFDGDGDSAISLTSAYFGEPLEWQARVLRVQMARDDLDRYIISSMGESIPRQNGKSWDVRARCFYGILCNAESILYTCQHGDTAGEMFRDLSEPFEDEDNVELHAMLKAVRKTNGQQSIVLKNGGYIRFTTRTNSLARGRSYDVIIYDEAQELTREQQAASLPTIAASKKQGSTQVIYIGTPPGPECCGDVFQDLHDRAHDGSYDGCWMEWGAGEVGDVADRSRWYETNPSLGTLIPERAVALECSSMDAETFARERLGWWSPVGTATLAIPQKLWQEARINAIGDKYKGKMAFGVKFSPDGARYALAGCKMRRDGHAAVELVEVGSTSGGTRALAEALHMRRSKACCVVIDGQAGAPALINNMADLKSPRGYVMTPRAGDVMEAAGMVLDSLRDGTLAHTEQTALDDSATTSIKRAIGKGGGWGFGSADGHDSTAIEAVSLALWGARTTRRDPTRKQRML